MSNYCLTVLKKKNSESFKKEQTKKIYNYLFNNVFEKNIDFKINTHHIKRTFQILDKIYFNNNITKFIKESKSNIKFNATSKLTKTAGYAKWKYYLDRYGNVSYGNFEIEISKPIINNIFLEKKIKSLKINGLHCFDRLECYINLFQHEIVHLLIAIFCTKDGYGMGGHTVMFRNIAFNLFGHTEYKHFLLAGDSIKMEEKEKINKSKIDIGDIVESIEYKKKGFVTNLTSKYVYFKMDNGKIWKMMYSLIDKVTKSKKTKNKNLLPEQIKNKLKLNDKVKVNLKGKITTGIVKNLGDKRASIILDNGQKWYIPYNLIIIK